MSFFFRFLILGGSIDLGDENSFNISDLGFDGVAGLALEADLSVLAESYVSSVIGIDMGGFTDTFLGDGNIWENRAAMDISTLADSLMDNMFLRDTELFARLNASAQSITGGVDVGLAVIGFRTE